MLLFFGKVVATTLLIEVNGLSSLFDFLLQNPVAVGFRKWLTIFRVFAVGAGDFDRFEWILAMDRRNLAALEAIRPPGFPGYLGLFLDLAPKIDTREVPDPYYGGVQGFEQVLDLAEQASAALLAAIEARIAARGRATDA